MSVKNELSVVCILASCQEHNAAQAKRWLRASDRSARDQLVSRCKEFGLDIATVSN